MLIAWDNKADDAALTTDSEITTLPASNVQQPHLSRKWHTAVGVKSAYLILDMGSNVTCDTVALLGTNLTSSATIRVRASTSDATVTGSLALDTGVVTANVVNRFRAVYKAVASTSARYWRLDLVDTTVSSNLQIGRVFLGPSWTPTINMQLGPALAYQDPSPRAKSRGGQTYVDRLPKFRTLSFTLDFLSKSEMYGNAFALAQDNGGVDDVLVVPDITDTTTGAHEAIWGLLSAGEPIVNDKLGLYRQKFTIEERL